MTYKEDTFEMPCGIEAAVKGLDEAVLRDKTRPIGVFASGDGKPTVNFYNEDGTTTAITLISGEWHELIRLVG